MFLHLATSVIGPMFFGCCTLLLGGFALFWARRCDAPGPVRGAGALLLLHTLLAAEWSVLLVLAGYPGPEWQEPAQQLVMATGTAQSVLSGLTTALIGVLLLLAVLRGGRTPAAPAAYGPGAPFRPGAPYGPGVPPGPGTPYGAGPAHGPGAVPPPPAGPGTAPPPAAGPRPDTGPQPPAAPGA
ncbi:hypothetical protein [Nocardiopsis trehalosi]|uniref:hypothetical protein n=1 Tax=Nocardiopsis trehalosi TaxID=109329 RepID=UPI00082A71AF|nr:hypothetical protein [Nocardiopsis trehalosi]